MENETLRCCPEWDEEFARLSATGTASEAYLVHFEWCGECQAAADIRVEDGTEGASDPFDDQPTGEYPRPPVPLDDTAVPNLLISRWVMGLIVFAILAVVTAGLLAVVNLDHFAN